MNKTFDYELFDSSNNYQFQEETEDDSSILNISMPTIQKHQIKFVDLNQSEHFRINNYTTSN